MDVSKKLEYALQHVHMIGGHETEEGAVRLHALKKVIAACEAEAKTIADQVAAKIESLG